MLSREQAAQCLGIIGTLYELDDEHYDEFTEQLGDLVPTLEQIVTSYYPGDEVLITRSGKRAKIKRLATVWQPGLYLLEMEDGSLEQHRYDHISHVADFSRILLSGTG